MTSDRRRSTIIGIDIGGTFTRGALVGDTGGVQSKTVRNTPRDGSILETVLGLKDELASKHGAEPDGIAIAVSFVVQPETGVVEASPKLGINERMPLQQLMQSRTGLPTVVRTELSMAALGEKTAQPNCIYDSLVVLTIGTGLGAGLIINGRPYVGSRGCAGEIGHIRVVDESNARLCSCGRRGCLEAYAASYSVTRQAGAGEWQKAEETVMAAQAGGKDAIRALSTTATYIGLAAAICANAYDPQAIVLRGGFVRNTWPLMSPNILTSFAQSALDRNVRLSLSPLADDGVFLGLLAEWSSLYA